MSWRFRITADGFLDVRDRRRVRTPGKFTRNVEPARESVALSFLLSHSFPGHRRVVRALRESERRLIRMALMADSIGERMSLVDRVWRWVTEPVPAPESLGEPFLLQVVLYGNDWAYPIHLDGEVTRVIPSGGMPLAKFEHRTTPQLDLKSA